MRRRFRILIIDDSSDVLAVLQAMLTAEGFEVMVAQDALAGLRAAYQDHPDAILLDFDIKFRDEITDSDEHPATAQAFQNRCVIFFGMDISL